MIFYIDLRPIAIEILNIFLVAECLHTYVTPASSNQFAKFQITKSIPSDGTGGCKLTLSTLGKIFIRRHFEICFLFFTRKQVLTFHANLSPMETICMKCPILFSEKKNNKENINLASAELAQIVVKVNVKGCSRGIC